MGGKLKFRCISNHVEDLADGSVVAPGEFVHLSEEDLKDPHNERLVAEGVLVGTGDKSEQVADKTEARVARREARAEAEEAKEGGS